MIPKELLKKIRLIDIKTRKSVNDIFAGEYHSVFKGRGMEFSEVRAYQYGDDVRTIDWNVTARMGEPYIKIFEEERELTVMLLVDVSSSGEFGTTNQLKREIALEICALLAFSADKNNDKVGLLMFTDNVERFIPPKKGRTHVLRILREILVFKPKQRKTDLKVALDYLNHVLNRKAIVFLASDFIDEGFENPLTIAARKHDLIPIVVTDPREEKLPSMGLLELEDAETGETVLIDTSDLGLQRGFQTNVTKTNVQREKTFSAIGIDAIEVTTDKPYINELERFFSKRSRRL
ncbi:MAG: DUF58 domain-containing protein [Candidatus Zixiibacteriota bacterium]